MTGADSLSLDTQPVMEIPSALWLSGALRGSLRRPRRSRWRHSSCCDVCKDVGMFTGMSVLGERSTEPPEYEEPKILFVVATCEALEWLAWLPPPRVRRRVDRYERKSPY